MNDNPEWNESRYFNFYDQKNGVAVLARVGNKPNKNEKTMFLFLISKGFTGAMRFGCPYDKDDMWSCANLSFKGEGDNHKIAYEGPIFDPMDKEKKPHMLKLDISWDALNPLVDYKGCVDAKGTEMSSSVASEHYEQFGTAKGTMILDGKPIDIDAEGERDMSSGVRDWASPKMWMWFNSTYSGKFGFNMTKLDTGSGEVDAGYFFDGKTHHINKIGIEVEYKGPVPYSYEASLLSKDGIQFQISGRTLMEFVAPTGIGDTALVEAVTETEWGGRKGYGIAEMLVHLGSR